MCGRFTQTKSRDEVLAELGSIELPPLFDRRYNIAPTQPVGVIRQHHPERVETAVWGFESLHSGSLVINARSETLRERTMFKNLLSANRCLIPADGFYEWKGRQPYYFQLENRVIFAFAGLWRNDRCVIITRAADANMQGIHTRMPVIFSLDEWEQWLTDSRPNSDSLFANHYSLTRRPVSRRVNSVAHDDSSCLDSADVQTDLSLFPDHD